MTLYAATSNPGKLAEFATSASSAGIEVRALPSLATMPEPREDAATFMGNAELKASPTTSTSNSTPVAPKTTATTAAFSRSSTHYPIPLEPPASSAPSL